MREETLGITPKDLEDLAEGKQILLLNDGETKVYVVVEDFEDISPTDDLEPEGEPENEEPTPMPESLMERDGRFPEM